MVGTVVNHERSKLEAFFGVPVIVQLKFPLVLATVKYKGKLPYADNTEKSHWVPEGVGSANGVEVMQFMQYAVLRPITNDPSKIELLWSSKPPDPMPGETMPIVATLSTLVDASDILSVTRVVSVPEPSSLILTGR